MAEGQGAGGFIRLPKTGRVPLYLLNGGDFEAGFEHWVELPGSTKPHKVVCTNDGKDPKKGAWDTDNCKLCDLAMESYKEAKGLREKARTNDQKLQAKGLKEFADRIKPKFSCHMVVVMGTTLTDKKLNPKTHKEQYTYKADFSLDGEMPAEIGIINLSDSQFLELKNLYMGKDAVNEKYPFMKAPEDRTNRVIWAVRGTNAKGNAKVFFVPEANPSDCPVDPDTYKDISIKDDFLCNAEEIEKVYAALTTGEGEESFADDGDVAFEEGAPEEGVDPDLSDLGSAGLEDGDPVGEEAMDEEPPLEEETQPAPSRERPAPTAARSRTAPAQSRTRPASSKAAPQKQASPAQRAAARPAVQKSGRTRL
jgi:hypothetical protein